MSETKNEPGYTGHRERVVQRFEREGLGSFTDIEALELLLFYAIPRKDTKDLARRLLDAFGSLEAVMTASAEELEAVKGVGPRAAALLRLVPDFTRRFAAARAAKGTVLNTSAAAAAYLAPFFLDRTEEALLMVPLDAKLKALGVTVLAEGAGNAVALDLRRLVQTALSRKAAAVILCHNHPGGVRRPSGEDRAVTGRVRDALKVVDVTLADHIIIAGEEYFSFADEGLL